MATFWHFLEKIVKKWSFSMFLHFLKKGHIVRQKSEKPYGNTPPRSVKITIKINPTRKNKGPLLWELFGKFDLFWSFLRFFEKKGLFFAFFAFFSQKWFFDIFWFFEMVLEPVSAGNSSPRSGKKRQNRAKKWLWVTFGVKMVFFSNFSVLGPILVHWPIFKKIFWLLEELDLFEICQNQV